LVVVSFIVNTSIVDCLGRLTSKITSYLCRVDIKLCSITRTSCWH